MADLKGKLPSLEDLCLTVRCPVCGALPDERCVIYVRPASGGGGLAQVAPHEERWQAYRQKRDDEEK